LAWVVEVNITAQKEKEEMPHAHSLHKAVVEGWPKLCLPPALHFSVLLGKSLVAFTPVVVREEVKHIMSSILFKVEGKIGWYQTPPTFM